MEHLLRTHAPITADTWSDIDDEATTRLAPNLGARKLVDFSGPKGWEYSAASLGRVGAALPAPIEGVDVRSRSVQPLAEVRVGFTLARTELEAATRGAIDVDYSALDDAAVRLARLENIAVFDGWAELGIAGIAASTPLSPISGSGAEAGLAGVVAAGVEALRDGGVGGPYGLALGDAAFAKVSGGSDAGGSPLFSHLERILGGPIVFVPGIAAPVLVSQRGGDFIFDSGEDISIGYRAHTADEVELYLEETFTFRIATPEAAVVLAGDDWT